MRCSEMWGVRYFYGPTGRWHGSRLYPTADEAVADFIALAGRPDVGAVRLYEPGYRRDDGYLWHDESMTRDERRQAARLAAMEVA